MRLWNDDGALSTWFAMDRDEGSEGFFSGWFASDEHSGQGFYLGFCEGMGKRHTKRLRHAPTMIVWRRGANGPT